MSSSVGRSHGTVAIDSDSIGLIQRSYVYDSGSLSWVPMTQPGGASGGDGAILDGVTASIKATVVDYANSNPLTVRLTDTNGDYVAAGAGTQYVDDAVGTTHPTGGALMLIRKDTPTTTTVSNDGDYIRWQGDAYGAGYVTLRSTVVSAVLSSTAVLATLSSTAVLATLSSTVVQVGSGTVTLSSTAVLATLSSTAVLATLSSTIVQVGSGTVTLSSTAVLATLSSTIVQVGSGTITLSSTAVLATLSSTAVLATLAATTVNIGTAVTVNGDVANATNDSGSPVKIGGYAITALPTAVANAQRVNLTSDKYGRQVVQIGTVRDLRGTQRTTISNTTAETTIVTAAASVFNDITGFLVSNSSATAIRIDFRDTTGGTIIMDMYSPAGQTIGIVLPHAGAPQSAVNGNWTAQCSASVTDIRIAAFFDKNK